MAKKKFTCNGSVVELCYFHTVQLSPKNLFKPLDVGCVKDSMVPIIYCVACVFVIFFFFLSVAYTDDIDARTYNYVLLKVMKIFLNDKSP